jgi:hypothetical protein
MTVKYGRHSKTMRWDLKKYMNVLVHTFNLIWSALKYNEMVFEKIHEQIVHTFKFEKLWHGKDARHASRT